MRATRKIIEIDEERCDGCGSCITACAEGALELVDGKAKVISDMYCDGLGACIGQCPRDALHIIEREADAFDEKAVADLLQKKEQEKESLPCGCPSTAMQTFSGENTECSAGRRSDVPSALSHWPVQIRLVAPDAPFLQNADVLVASDCTAFAYPSFHQDFLTGRAALIGCPKFDDRQLYLNRFVEIFSRNAIRSITIVVMEVPCCHGMPSIVKEALMASGKKIPLEIDIVSMQGKIVKRIQEAA